MSGIAKIISIIIVLLLLGGLTFAIFSFVDHSKKANERLNNETKQEQKIKRQRRQREKKNHLTKV